MKSKTINVKMKSNAEIVLQALLLGIIIDIPYTFEEGKIYSYITIGYDNGLFLKLLDSSEDWCLLVDFDLADFVAGCNCMSFEQIAIVVSNIVLTKRNKEDIKER